MIKFRDEQTRQLGLELIVHTNEDGVRAPINPFSHGSRVHTDVMKPGHSSRRADRYGFDALPSVAPVATRNARGPRNGSTRFATATIAGIPKPASRTAEPVQRPGTQGRELYSNAQHPYTQALLSSIPIPDVNANGRRIRLAGDVPSPFNPPSGCCFHTRCAYARPECSQCKPELKDLGSGHMVACHLCKN